MWLYKLYQLMVLIKIDQGMMKSYMKINFSHPIRVGVHSDYEYAKNKYNNNG